jgi:plastocyanin
MNIRLYRPILALGAVAMAAAAILSIALTSGRPAAATDAYVIEISDTAINPAVCKVNRGDAVRWKNAGAVAHQVSFLALGSEQPWMTEVIEPGTTSKATFQVQGGFNATYHLVDNPAITAQLQGPPTSNTWQVACTPIPPTPTPTPTPSVTATPTATSTSSATPSPTPSPTPTPPPVPPRCIGQYGCAVAPQIARDAS